MWKRFLILGLLLTVGTGYFFWASHHKQRMQQVVPSAVTVEESTTRDDMEVGSQKMATDAEKTQELSQPSDTDNTAEPEMTDRDKKIAALEKTPEYAEFLETGGNSLYDLLGFYASHGIEVDKNVYHVLFDRIFKENFPGETPMSAEPKLRQELVNRLNASDTDDDLDVVVDFIVEEKHSAWGSLYFETDSVAYSNWVMGVLNEHQSTVADPVVVETEPTILPTETTESGAANERLLDDIPTASSEQPSLLSTEPPVLEAGDVLTESGTDIDAEFRKLIESTLPEAPILPTLVEFEKSLRENFSPNRFNSAIQTLNRYGPEDGLRRLKASDPEVAKHFERLIQVEQEN